MKDITIKNQFPGPQIYIINNNPSVLTTLYPVKYNKETWMNESGYLNQIWIYDRSNKKVQKYSREQHDLWESRESIRAWIQFRTSKEIKLIWANFQKHDNISRFSTKNFDEDQSIKGVYMERLTMLWWRSKMKAGGSNEMLQPGSERWRKICIWSMFCLKKTIKKKKNFWRKLCNLKKKQRTRLYKKQLFIQEYSAGQKQILFPSHMSHSKTS